MQAARLGRNRFVAAACCAQQAPSPRTARSASSVPYSLSAQRGPNFAPLAKPGCVQFVAAACRAQQAPSPRTARSASSVPDSLSAPKERKFANASMVDGAAYMQVRRSKYPYHRVYRKSTLFLGGHTNASFNLLLCQSLV